MGSLLDKITLPGNYDKNQVAKTSTKTSLPVKLDTTLRSTQSSKKDAIIQQTLKNGGISSSSKVTPLPSTAFTSKPQSQKTATEIANTKSMSQKVADNYARASAAAETQKANPLSTIKAGEWGIAICDNSNPGQHITDWGYMTTSVEGGVDGQAYLINSEGQIKSLHTGTESEDYAKKVREVEAAAKESKDKFELAHKFQEMAQTEAERRIQTGDDPDSAADILKKLMWINGELLNDPDSDNRDKYTQDLKDMVTSYVKSRETISWVNDHVSITRVQKVRDEYVDRYNNSSNDERLSIYQDLYNDKRITDEQKERIAYICNYGAHTFNPVKGAFNAVGELEITPSNMLGDVLAGGVIEGAEGLEKAAQGKFVTTGNTAADLVIYTLTDPGTILNLGGLASKAATVSDVTGVAAKSAKNVSNTKMMQAISRQDNALDAAKQMARTMNPTDAEEFIKQMTETLEYSKAYNISKSLKSAADSLNEADKIANKFTSLGLTGTAAHKIVSKLTKSDVSAKCLGDAAAQTIGDSGKEIDVRTYSKFIQNYEKNLAGASFADMQKYTQYLSLTDDEKYQLFAEVYMNQRKKTSSLAQLNKDAADAMVQLELQDRPLYQVLVGGVDVDFTIDAHRAKSLPVDYATGNSKRASLERSGLSFVEDSDITIDDVKSDRLYALKYNDTKIAESIRTNEMYRALSSDTPSSDLLRLFDDSQAGSTLKELWASGIGTRNYERVIDKINSSIHIPAELKDAVIDFLYNRKFMTTISRTMYAEEVTAAAMTQKARSLARKWLDGAYSMDAAWKSTNKYLNYACNTADSAVNAENIAKLFMSNPALAAEKTDYIFYSAKLGSNGLLDNISLHVNGKTHTFSVDQLLDLDQFILGTMSESQKTRNRVKFIGFNNHATGFDTDFAMQAEFRRHRVATASRFLHSVDLAEVMRVNDGFAIDLHGGVYDRMLDELTDTVEEAIHNWQMESIACDAIGYKSRFSMTAPTYEELDDIVNRLNNMAFEAYTPEQADFLGKMTEDLGLTVKYLNDQHSVLVKDLGWLELTDDVLRKVRDAAGPEVAMTTLLDKKKMLHWSDCGDIKVKYAEALKKAVDSIDASSKQMYCEEFFDVFQKDIEDYYDAAMNLLFDGTKGQSNKALGMQLGIVSEDGRFLLKANTPREKTAVLLYMRHQGIFAPELLDEDFDMAIRHAYGKEGLIVRPTGRYFVKDEVLQGSVGNVKSSWNMQEEQYYSMACLTDSFERLDELEEFRRATGLTDPMAVQNVRIMHNLKSEYNMLKAKMERDALKSMAKRSDATNKYSEFWDRVQKIGKYDKANRAWSEMATNHEFDKMLWLGKLMESKEFEKYVATYCHGRLVVDVSNLSTVQRGRVVQKFVDAGMTHDGNLLKFSTDMLPDEHYKAPRLRLPSEIKNLAKYNNESFTFGQFLPDDYNNHMFFMNKYFPGEEMRMAEDTATTGYFCSYIGPITGMVGEGSYASANTLTNLFNSYNRTLQLVDHKGQLVKTVFSGPNFAAWCGMTDPAVVKTELINRGYIILGYNEKGVVDLTAQATDRILNFKGSTAVVGAEDWKKLNETLTFKRSTKEPNMLMKAYQALRTKQIRFMLMTNPGTAMHNWIDSTTKAVLTEGAGHIPYMVEAADVLAKYDELEKYISKTYGYDIVDALGDVQHNHNINADTIIRALEDADFGISKERALQMLQLKRSTLFDTKVSEFFKKESDMAKWNVIGKFNEKMFSGAEHINRTAIALAHLDAGDTMDGAYKAIKASQFDYAKNGFLRTLDTISPFSTFKIYNTEFWMYTALQECNQPLLRAFYRLQSTKQYEEDDFMSDDEMRWRAWLDTLPVNGEYEREPYTYSTWEDYRGTTGKTATENGWLKIGDKYYFKSGLSFLDAFSGEKFFDFCNIFTDRSEMRTWKDYIEDIWEVFSDGMYAPIEAAGNIAIATITDSIPDRDEIFEGFANGNNNKLVDSVLQIIPYYPIMTAAKTAVRNYLYALRDGGNTAEAIRDAGLYSIISRGASDDDIDWYATKMYLNRVVGVDWYNMTEAQQDKFRYVMGISYIPAWVKKDPTTYIDTFGRLAEMGIGYEQAQWLMDNGGALWFTQNNEGEYELHNYKLMCGDMDTYNAWFDKLVNFWGWSEEKAQLLLDKIAEPMWQTKEYKAYRYGYKSNGRADISKVNGYGRYKKARYVRMSKASFNKIRYAGFSSEFSPFSGSWSRYDRHPKQWSLASRLMKGKNVDYSQYGIKRYNNGIDMGNFKRTYPRWHRRTRDIYDSNYARYGASRMAMEQNLKNYSNRSITEMRRTNQSMRYADIHRHTAW